MTNKTQQEIEAIVLGRGKWFNGWKVLNEENVPTPIFVERYNV